MTRRKRPGKEEVIAAVRAAVGACGGKPMGMRKFLAVSGMKSNDVYDLFMSWSGALRAAGYDVPPYHRRLDDDTLLADWAALVRKLKRPPTRKEYHKYGKYGLQTLVHHFRGLILVQHAFRDFVARHPEWKDVLALLPEKPPEFRPRQMQARPGSRRARRNASIVPNGRPICGELLGIEGMQNAPLNEIGVIFLFAILAGRLGFHVESLQSGFPDCEARRRLSPGTYQTVRIEFEYESRNFRNHGHRPDGCDIIVCWVHNWEECPENLEVIALSEEVKQLAHAVKI